MAGATLVCNHSIMPDLARIFHSHLGRVAKNAMKRGAQARSNAWLKRHGAQVWKPVAIQQAGKPALRRGNAAVLAKELLRAFSA